MLSPYIFPFYNWFQLIETLSFYILFFLLFYTFKYHLMTSSYPILYKKKWKWGLT